MHNYEVYSRNLPFTNFEVFLCFNCSSKQLSQLNVNWNDICRKIFNMHYWQYVKERNIF